jgi:carboxyl-terminal processing protease
MKNRTNLLIAAKVFGAFILANVLFLSGYFIGGLNSTKVTPDNDNDTVVNTASSHNEIDVKQLWNVWDLINTDYLKKDVDNQELFYGAVKGLVSSLNDPYTNFLTPTEVADYKKSVAGQLEGIGVTLRQEGEYAIIESVVDGFPASKNGILSNDVIVKVDGIDVQGKNVNEVATLIRGKAGTNVKIDIYRPATKKDINLDITREAIDINNITIGDFKDGIQVIKIYKFTEDTQEKFNQLWDTTVEKVLAKNPKGIIIDLRGNPGGYVSGVEYILNDFLVKGKVIFSEETRDGNKTDHVVTRDGRLLNVPMVVIVNGGSASASEIMTGALQDYKRATVVGEKTVGKGVEQKLINLDDGSQLQLVFRKWLTPNGNNINREQPLTPDVIIEEYSAQTQKAYDLLKK